MSQTYYLDADIIIAYFDEDDREKYGVARKTIGKVKSTIRRNPEIDVKIPSIALAEIFSWFLKDSRLPRVSHDFPKLMNDLRADFPSPRKEHYKEAVHSLRKTIT